MTSLTPRTFFLNNGDMLQWSSRTFSQMSTFFNTELRNGEDRFRASTFTASQKCKWGTDFRCSPSPRGERDTGIEELILDHDHVSRSPEHHHAHEHHHDHGTPSRITVHHHDHEPSSLSLMDAPQLRISTDLIVATVESFCEQKVLKSFLDIAKAKDRCITCLSNRFISRGIDAVRTLPSSITLAFFILVEIARYRHMVYSYLSMEGSGTISVAYGEMPCSGSRCDAVGEKERLFRLLKTSQLKRS